MKILFLKFSQKFLSKAWLKNVPTDNHTGTCQKSVLFLQGAQKGCEVGRQATKKGRVSGIIVFLKKILRSSGKRLKTRWLMNFLFIPTFHCDVISNYWFTESRVEIIAFTIKMLALCEGEIIICWNFLFNLSELFSIFARKPIDQRI